MPNFNVVAKAFTGALLSGLAALQVATAGGRHLTVTDWVTVAIAVVASFTLVWAVPNAVTPTPVVAAPEPAPLTPVVPPVA